MRDYSAAEATKIGNLIYTATHQEVRGVVLSQIHNALGRAPLLAGAIAKDADVKGRGLTGTALLCTESGVGLVRLGNVPSAMDDFADPWSLSVELVPPTARPHITIETEQSGQAQYEDDESERLLWNSVVVVEYANSPAMKFRKRDAGNDLDAFITALMSRPA